MPESVTELKEQLSKLEKNNNALAAPKWEYVVRDNPSAEDIKFFGVRGWELVNFASFTTGFGLGGNESYKVSFRYVFKRPIAKLEGAEAAELRDKIAQLSG